MPPGIAKRTAPASPGSPGQPPGAAARKGMVVPTVPAGIGGRYDALKAIRGQSRTVRR
jgi:hypothetical protein